MSRDRHARLLMSRLSHPPFTNVIPFCGVKASPGHDEIPEWQIWTERQTTDDQLRIEEQLERCVRRSSSILHVGAGNSSLARRFAPRVASILGITIHGEEQILANDMKIENYVVRLINKFSRDMDGIQKHFDFIVDNNPSSFACCLFHFLRMMISYKELLRDGGIILTEELGLGWVCTNNNPDWSLKWRDRAKLGEVLQMPVNRITTCVYSMERVAGSGLRGLP